jgi:hypothetical protein
MEFRIGKSKFRLLYMGGWNILFPLVSIQLESEWPNPRIFGTIEKRKTGTNVSREATVEF